MRTADNAAKPALLFGHLWARRLCGAYRPGNQEPHNRTRWDASGREPNERMASPMAGWFVLGFLEAFKCGKTSDRAEE